MCWIEFGCPGHGKGPWDGLGAVLKQQVTRDITNKKILTASGYIGCPQEVAEHLRARFMTAEWMRKHQDKHINEMVIFYAHHDEIERPRVEHTFDSLVGSMSSCSYMMLARDQIARRTRSCWCYACLGARGRQNMLSVGDKLVMEHCSHADKPEWVQQAVRDQGTGSASRRKEAQELGKKLAVKLEAPTEEAPNRGFMAIQAREAWSETEDAHYRPGHYWLAQAPDVLDIQQIKERKSIEGTMFSPGDYLVRIGRYFERDPSDASGLKFVEWVPPNGDGPFLINATELRAVNFTMTPSTVLQNPLSEVRRSGRLSHVISVPPTPRPKEYWLWRPQAA